MSSGATPTLGVSIRYAEIEFPRGVVLMSIIGRANAACMLACYMVLIQSWPPHLALAPIAQMDPPCMPFRDAGYSQADYVLNIQDIIYGVWKAKEEGLCGLKDFSLEEYVRTHQEPAQALTGVDTRSTSAWIWATSTG